MKNNDFPIYRGVNKGQQYYLYYYNGNFFYPLFLCRKEKLRIKSLIRIFYKNNKEMILKDRASPAYKTKLQLFDEQMNTEQQNDFFS